jgi:cytidylate kinase
MLARHLGIIYVDTGALYRTVGLRALERGADAKDAAQVTALLEEISIEMRHDAYGGQRVILNGEDVTDKIRSPTASVYASDVSAHPAVRSFLLDMQRSMAKKYDVVMDGRDIGTVIMPDAGVKLFLTASPEVRAQRRFAELCERGVETTYESVLRDINYRDDNDRARASAPLRKPEGAIEVDTSEIGLEASFEQLRDIISERLKVKNDRT